MISVPVAVVVAALSYHRTKRYGKGKNIYKDFYLAVFRLDFGCTQLKTIILLAQRKQDLFKKACFYSDSVLNKGIYLLYFTSSREFE